MRMMAIVGGSSMRIFLLLLTGCGFAPAPALTGDNSRPETFILQAPAALITQSVADFEFDSDEPDVSYDVYMDGKGLGNFSSRVRVDDLAEGRHVLSVVAKRADGTRDRSHAVHVWSVDTRAPVIAVTFPPRRSLTDTGTVAVCGTLVEESGLASLTVNGVNVHFPAGSGTWRAIVPVDEETVLRVVATDIAGNIVVNADHRITPVEPPPPPPAAPDPRDEFELIIDADANEALVVEPTQVVAIDLDTAERRVVSSSLVGSGEAFKDIVVMTRIPDNDELVVFDTFRCRITTVDIATGNRDIIWSRLGPSDIPATREGLIASDGVYAYVQGPRDARLVALKLDGTEQRTLAANGWAQDAVALTWDPVEERLLAADAKAGDLYAINPTTGAKTTVSAHDPQHPLGYARGLALDGTSAYVISKDGNGVLEIDLETGEREFLPLIGDGLIRPLAIAIDLDDRQLVVLDHGREGLMFIDLDDGNCRERVARHEPRPECVGPIYLDDQSGELCLLDGGRCTLVALDRESGAQRALLDLADDAPDAVDFHINPETGEPVVLERHGIYIGEPGTLSCRAVPPDPAAPLGGGLALRVEEGGRSALILDSRPHTIDWDWIRSTVRKDRVVRVDLKSGKCTLLVDQAAAGFGDAASATGGLFLDEQNADLYLGAVECGPYGACYRGTIKLFNMDVRQVETVYGVDRTEGNTTYLKGGTATPPDDFGILVRDPVRNRIYTYDRVNKVVGRIHFEGPNPRYEVIAGDLPH